MRHETSELMWNGRSTSYDGIVDMCVNQRYIRKCQHYQYCGRSTKFGLDVEASGWAVIVGFGA